MAFMSSSSARVLGHTYPSPVFWLAALLLLIVFCLTTRLKQEEDKTHDLRQAHSAEREEAYARLTACQKELSLALGDLRYTELQRETARNGAKELHSMLNDCRADRDRIKAMHLITKRNLHRKKAAVEQAKTNIDLLSADVEEAKTKISLLSAELRECLENRPETQGEGAARKHECSLCMEEDVDALFPCGHVACCMNCALKLPSPADAAAADHIARCPHCRTEGGFRKVYFA